MRNTLRIVATLCIGVGAFVFIGSMGIAFMVSGNPLGQLIGSTLFLGGCAVWIIDLLSKGGWDAFLKKIYILVVCGTGGAISWPLLLRIDNDPIPFTKIFAVAIIVATGYCAFKIGTKDSRTD